MFEDILHFWFIETSPPQWWKADPQFDAVIAARFGALHAAALRGELFEAQFVQHKLREIDYTQKLFFQLFWHTEKVGIILCKPSYA